MFQYWRYGNCFIRIFQCVCTCSLRDEGIPLMLQNVLEMLVVKAKALVNLPIHNTLVHAVIARVSLKSYQQSVAWATKQPCGKN